MKLHVLWDSRLAGIHLVPFLGFAIIIFCEGPRRYGLQSRGSHIYLMWASGYPQRKCTEVSLAASQGDYECHGWACLFSLLWLWKGWSHLFTPVTLIHNVEVLEKLQYALDKKWQRAFVKRCSLYDRMGILNECLNIYFKYKLLSWGQSWIFSIFTPSSLSHGSSEIIVICRCSAQEAFLTIITIVIVKNSCAT